MMTVMKRKELMMTSLVKRMMLRYKSDILVKQNIWHHTENCTLPLYIVAKNNAILTSVIQISKALTLLAKTS